MQKRGILDTRKRVVVYIVSGEEYYKEARLSIGSLPPDLDHFILTPGNEYDLWYLNSVACLAGIFDRPELENYEHFLLLDTDTFVCGSLDDFFTVLDRYDIAGTHAIGRETMVRRDDIPASFPELHIGAMSFRRNVRTQMLFEYWLWEYKRQPEFYGNNDQGPLRAALWKSPDIRLAVLPAEFCFRYRWGGLVSGPVRVLHGRENGTPYEKIVRQVQGGGIRVYSKRELA